MDKLVFHVFNFRWCFAFCPCGMDQQPRREIWTHSAVYILLFPSREYGKRYNETASARAVRACLPS